MNRVAPIHRRRVSAAAVLLAAGALFAVPAARADFPLPHELHRELHHEVRSLVHNVLRSLDRIPVEIHGNYGGDLEVFFVANEYYAPHRHYHAAYNFPVWIDGGVVYRPYVYCNSRLYGDYRVRPQFWSGWGEPSQGRWCGHHHAYYPTVHACFRPQYRSQVHRQYRSDSRQGYRQGYRRDYGQNDRRDDGQNYRRDDRQGYRRDDGQNYRRDDRQGYRRDDRPGYRQEYRPGRGSHPSPGYRSPHSSDRHSQPGPQRGWQGDSKHRSHGKQDKHPRHDGDGRHGDGRDRH